MNILRNLALVILHLSLVAVGLPAKAGPLYWLSVETEASDTDESEGGHFDRYVMYYCSVDKANELFGGASVDKIEGYVKKNFSGAKGLATTYDSVSYSDGEYHILDYVSAAFDTADYVAFALYGSDSYRVFGKGSAALTPYGSLVFNESSAASGTVGDWQQTVPEPTSGLLLLIGLAGIALRRKCGQV